jgi:hypothetical protein
MVGGGGGGVVVVIVVDIHTYVVSAAVILSGKLDAYNPPGPTTSNQRHGPLRV